MEYMILWNNNKQIQNFVSMNIRILTKNSKFLSSIHCAVQSTYYKTKTKNNNIDQL